MPGPLAGVRVIDCSTVLAGPYCTMVLGDLGADVVKVEPPEGDATRGWGPPWVGSEADGTQTATYYLAINRNKRSLRLDLRQEAGREVLRTLLRDADVVVENFRPDVKFRLKVDYESLKKINPRLVYGSVSGFGQDGPYRDRPGFDQIAQGMGGLMSITGLPGQGPVRVGIP
ncbi:MAG TPA: CoA transferase, partial [Candidatus Limnocylindrales bacterium]